MSSWTPKTYEDAARARLPAAKRSGRLDWAHPKLREIEGDPDPAMALPQRPGKDQAETLIQCPGCRVWTPPWALIDVRGFPGDLTQGQAWACPGCWETWFREKKITRAQWLELHGAPAALIAKAKGG